MSLAHTSSSWCGGTEQIMFPLHISRERLVDDDDDDNKDDDSGDWWVAAC